MIYANPAAKSFWNALPPSQRARSLALGHFAEIKRDKDDNTSGKNGSDAVANAAVLPRQLGSWMAFYDQINRQGAAVFPATSQARIIIGASSGAIENAGLTVDRNSGIPILPASACKGIARRNAIHQLSEEEDLDKKTALLEQIARVFGWADQEWKAGRKAPTDDGKHPFAHSDFWLAMKPIYAGTDAEVDAERDRRWTEVLGKLPEDLPESAAGTIRFFPGLPTTLPVVETDVLTCHHPKYYKGDREDAMDTENPIPVFFPTIASGCEFRFAIQPTGRAPEGDLDLANGWLREALEVFGIGAKTAAGYGWFEVSEDEESDEELAIDEAVQAELQALSDEQLKVAVAAIDAGDRGPGYRLTLYQQTLERLGTSPQLSRKQRQGFQRLKAEFDPHADS